MKFDIFARKSENLVAQFRIDDFFEKSIDYKLFFTIEEIYSEEIVIRDFIYELSESIINYCKQTNSYKSHRFLTIIVDRDKIEKLKFNRYHYDLILDIDHKVRFRLSDGIIVFED